MFIVTMSRRQIYRKVAYMSVLGLLALVTLAAGSGVLPTIAPGDNDSPLTRAEITENRVALTFDVTWGTQELGKILGTLGSSEVKATFFVGGTFLSLNGNLVKQVAAGGHEIGTLGQKMVDLTGLPEQEVATNLLESQSLLSKILGGPVRYFRPPMGAATPPIVRSARQANLVTVTYSLDSQDHLGLRASEITSRVVKKAQPGDIILLSASDWSKETNKAIPEIIKGLKARGFAIVRISDLVPATTVP